MHKNVPLIVERSNGSSRGNESTGNSVPFELARDINAAIIVKTPESPKFPSEMIKKNNPKLLIVRLVIATYKNIMNRLRIKVSIMLKRSFPKNTELEPLISFNNKDVPRSSSATKTLESPLDAAKNIIIHSMPALISFDNFSSPSENLITDITTITNISSALTA
jgi:hypothetical protein